MYGARFHHRFLKAHLEQSAWPSLHVTTAMRRLSNARRVVCFRRSWPSIINTGTLTNAIDDDDAFLWRPRSNLSSEITRMDLIIDCTDFPSCLKWQRAPVSGSEEKGFGWNSTNDTVAAR
jgi:hypothetical protein